MAKRLTTEDIQLNIIINGNKAQKELFDLEKQNRSYKKSNDELRASQRKMREEGKQNTAAYKALSAEIKQNTTTMNANKVRMAELQNEIGITGLSLRQLQKRANELKSSMRTMIPGSAMFKNVQAELAAVNARMQQLRTGAQAQQSTWSRLANWTNKYQTVLLSLTATITGVVFSLKSLIDYQGQYADQVSNVQKTTGLAKTEVEEMAKSFGELDTRTSSIDLLKIAEEAGRLGIAKEEVADFTRVMDKATVALGDSFTGGVEEVASSLGKIKGLFAETRNAGVAESFEAIGSAINELGANGAATERNIADFTQRLGALPDAIKPTIAEALALGAAFEESGIDAEIAGRAYSIFIKQASTEVDKFAEVMGISSAEVERMINSDPTGFFLAFSEKLKGVAEDGTDMAKALDYLGVNADGVNKIIGAAGNNTERFREMIELSNVSMGEATSLTNEFNIKNENLAAVLEKIQKKVVGWMSNETFTQWLATAVNWFAKFIGASEDADGSVTRFRDKFILLIKVLAIAATAFLSYKSAVLLTTLVTKGLATATRLLTVAQTANAVAANLVRSGLLILQAVYLALTGNITRASAAMRLFHMTALANPWGLILGFISAIAAAFIIFSDNAEDAADSLDKLSASEQVNIEKNRILAKSVNDVKAKIDVLIAVIENENSSLETRKKAYQELINIAPEFIGTLDAEYRATNKLAEAYSLLIQRMEAKALAQARQKVRQKIADDLAEAEAQEYESQKRLEKMKQEYEKSGKKGTFSEYFNERFAGGFGKLMDSKEAIQVQMQIKAAQMAKESAMEKLDQYNDYQTTEINKLLEKQKNLKKGSEEFKKVQNEIDAIIGSAGTGVSGGTGVPSGGLNIPTGRSGSSSRSSVSSGPSEAERRAEEEKRAYEQRMAELYRMVEQAENEVIQLRREKQMASLELLEDGAQKEIQIVRAKLDFRLDDLEMQMRQETAMQTALEKEKTEAQNKGQTERVQLLDTLIQQSKIKYQELSVAGLQEEKKSLQEEGIILAKGIEDQLKKRQEQYNREKDLREVNFMEELNQIETLDEAKAILSETLDEKELKRIRTLQEAKDILQKQHNEKELETQTAHLQELRAEMEKLLNAEQWEGIDMELLTEEQKQAMLDRITELRRAIAELQGKSLDDEEATGTSSSNLDDPYGVGLNNTDILGMTPNQWETLFNNIGEGKFRMQEFLALAGALQSAFQQYYAFVNANEQRSWQAFERATNNKKQALENQLQQGYISKENYDKQMQKLDEDFNKKRADMEYKQAKREKQMAYVSAVMSIAQGVAASLAQGGIVGPILAGIVAAMGAIQIATISKQPLPARGYEEGYYDKLLVRREQDGKVFKAENGGASRSGIVDRPTLFNTPDGGRYLAGERSMPEMIIHSDALRQFSPQLKTMLYSELPRIVPGYEKGYYPNGGQPPEANKDKAMEMMMALMAENISLLKEIKEEGLRAIVTNRDMNSMRNLQEGLEEYQDLRTKNKR